MRSNKVDLEQRFNDIFAMPSFATDPLRPYGLKFTDAQDAVISLGDNAGTARGLYVKNKANSQTYFSITPSSISITPNATGNLLSIPGGAANADNYISLATNSIANQCLMIIEGAGGGFITGSTTNSAIFGSSNPGFSLHLSTNQRVEFTIASGGNITIPNGTFTVTTGAIISTSVAISGAVNSTFTTSQTGGKLRIINTNAISGTANFTLESTAAATFNWLLTINYDSAGEFALRSSNAGGGDPYTAGVSVFRLTRLGALTIAAGFTVSSGGIDLTGSPPSVAASHVGFGGSTRTTIGANGAATALTANPLGYLDINVAGTIAQVPYYNRGA